MVAQIQELAGFDPSSSNYLTERNRLFSEWKKDKIYVARTLKRHWERNGKRPVIAFDNTDQLAPALQDHCFLLAQNTARELQCTSIISMREERYCRARTVGVLDAYQNVGFHLAAPSLEHVFTKRIRLVINDLEQRQEDLTKLLPDDAPFDELTGFFKVCVKQFREDRNALKRFLEECSRDNTRRALEFFRQFISSGYTHVGEMVANQYWTVISHQVVKPMMIPQRFNYDENKSLIPNIYQCRNRIKGSHFTSIRFLHTLRSGISTTPIDGGFLRVEGLLDNFEAKYGSREDCEVVVDMMLQHGLIEANNRLDKYSVEKAGSEGQEQIFADEVRITAFGIYMLDELSRSFSYLDLVSLDCGLADESLYHQFCNMAARERSFGSDKTKRLESRLERASLFLKYLEVEESKEKTEFALTSGELFMSAIVTAFEIDKLRALESARRNA